MSEPCPKCAYVRQPGDTAAEGECPSCGVYYEKYRQRMERQAAGLPEPALAPLPAVGWQRDLWQALWAVPERVDQTAFYGRCAVLALIVVWGGWFILTPWYSQAIGASFLHRPDLAFHEFGHLLFRPFGEFMMFLGGSLFQCLLPLLLAGYFIWKQQQPFSAAVCLWWCGQNFIDVAPYIGDARALALPLVGEWGDDSSRAFRHDWHNILGMLGWLQADYALGRLAKIIGSLLMLLSWAWAGLLLQRQYRRLSGDVFNETDVG